MKKSPAIVRALGYASYTLGSIAGGIRAGWRGDGHEYFRQFEGGERNRFRDRPKKLLQSEDDALNLNNREELMSEARSLAMTYGIVRRILRNYTNYCVGSCRVKWNTGDTNMDTLYQEEWRNWMPNADVNGVMTFRTMTRLALASALRDGDIFGQEAIMGKGKDAEPAIRMIEADRVSSSGMFNSDLVNPDEPEMHGGIFVGRNGRPVFARVWERGGFGTFRNPVEIPYTELLHPFSTDRVDSYRGVTSFHTALNALRDLKETIQAERLSAKRNSKLSLLVKTITGGRIPGAAFNPYSPDGAGGADGFSHEEVGDAVDLYMFPNENATAHASNRPSEGWIKLMEWLVREISVGVDLPFGVVWNMAGLGGATARFETFQANRTFVNVTEELVERKWIIPIAGWVISKRIEQGRLPFHPNWYKFAPHRAASITVDIGRDSKAGINEIAAGLNTSSRWVAEDDCDFEEITERQAQEQAFREAMQEKYKLKQPLGSPIMIASPNAFSAANAEEEEPETKDKKDNGNKTSSASTNED